MALNCVVDISNYILNSLRNNCSTIDFVSEFPSEVTDFPVKKPTVSLGIKKANLPFSECIFEGVDTKGNKYYGTTAKAELSLNICVPKTMAGINCYMAFDTIADVCLGLTAVNVTDIYCEDIEYNRTMGALVLKAGIKLSAELYSKVGGS